MAALLGHGGDAQHLQGLAAARLRTIDDAAVDRIGLRAGDAVFLRCRVTGQGAADEADSKTARLAEKAPHVA
jgi:hypothetical protein